MIRFHRNCDQTYLIVWIPSQFLAAPSTGMNAITIQPADIEIAYDPDTETETVTTSIRTDYLGNPLNGTGFYYSPQPGPTSANTAGRFQVAKTMGYDDAMNFQCYLQNYGATSAYFNRTWETPSFEYDDGVSFGVTTTSTYAQFVSTSGNGYPYVSSEYVDANNVNLYINFTGGAHSTITLTMIFNPADSNYYADHSYSTVITDTPTPNNPDIIFNGRVLYVNSFYSQVPSYALVQDILSGIPA